jgi:glycosyltransferase involved in cell wall biosynthesis
MRIGVDIRPFLSRETGVGTYLRHLLFELARIDPRNEYCLFSSSWKERFPPGKVPPFSKLRFRDVRIPVRAMNFLWYRMSWPPLERFFGGRLDLTHSPTPVPLPGRSRKIVTVYDLYFLDDPGRSVREARKVFAGSMGASLARADGILAISEFTRRSILERFPVPGDKIAVAPLGLNPLFAKDVPDAALEVTRLKYRLPDRFLLFVGAVEKRKNIVNLLEALARIRKAGEPVDLVLAGREGEASAEVGAAVARLGLGPAVRSLGYLPDPVIRDLYRLARLLVFPSLCEGFGLPLLEAMASSLPAAVSRTGALPEVGGDAAAYFDPEDPADIARAILELLGDEPRRRELAEKGKRRSSGFGWAETARRTLAFYERTAGAQ